MKVDVVILAGAPADPDMSPPGVAISRAMVEVGAKTMLQWILDALKSAETIGRIVAVGNVTADGIDQVVPPSDGFLDNLMLGLNACGECERVLVTTSDIPMITSESIDDFVRRAADSGGEMCYPIIPKADSIAKYPGMKRTYLKTREGTFTGGNMMLFSPEFLWRNEKRISDAYAARKKPLALASMIGFGVLMRAAAAQTLCQWLLPIPTLERSVSKVLGGRVVAVRTHYPEIGADVDKASDLEAVRAILG